MTRVGEADQRHVDDGEDPAIPSRAGRGRILAAGLIGAALALAGIAADAFL